MVAESVTNTKMVVPAKDLQDLQIFEQAMKVRPTDATLFILSIMARIELNLRLIDAILANTARIFDDIDERRRQLSSSSDGSSSWDFSTAQGNAKD